MFSSSSSSFFPKGAPSYLGGGIIDRMFLAVGSISENMLLIFSVPFQGGFVGRQEFQVPVPEDGPAASRQDEIVAIEI